MRCRVNRNVEILDVPRNKGIEKIQTESIHLKYLCENDRLDEAETTFMKMIEKGTNLM